jgi:signal transduction histidine kinase
MDSRVFTEESVGRLRSAVNAAMSDGTPFETEVSALRPDRSMRHLAVRGVAVREKSGAVSGVEGTMQDITELREAEQLRDEWTSVIAHDLRQPIGVILMAASALPEMHKGEVTDDEKLFVSRIVAAGNTLARMVDDLLDLSLLEAHRLELQRRWVNPRDFVSETVGRLAHITAGHPVRFSQEGGVGDVFVDPMRIGQVLGNLTSNAVKYGEPGTDIDVRLAQRDHEVEISVTNHGRGISPEDMPRLFSRFMRSKQTRTRVPGLGVGLYISRELVEAHQGRIWAESTPGKTTTFHLTLPARVTPAKVA